MANTANIKAVITAEDKASKVLAGVGNSFNQLMKMTAAGAAVAAAGAFAFGVSAVKSFQESENAAAQLNAVLKSTGGVAGVTADEANGLASSLQKVTKFSDEAILGGESLLLTFTNIGKDIFPQATETMLNMSQALGQDVKSSAIQLGKALQDPILGVTALRRVGVNFSSAQQDVIKKLVETGKAGEAQAMILKELQTEFGGSAKAAGQTFAGKLEILKNSFDDIKESVGLVIVKALTPFASKLAEVLGNLGQIEFGIQVVTDWLIAFFTKLKDIGTQVWQALLPSLTALANTLTTQLFPALYKLYQDVLVPLAPIFGTLLVTTVWVWINSLNVLAKVITVVANVVTSLYLFFTTTFVAGITNVFNWVVAKANWLKDNFWSVIGNIIGFFATLPYKIPLFVAMAMAGAVRAVLSVNWGSVFSGIWQAMQGVWDRVSQMAVNAWHGIMNINWGAALSGIGKSLANSVIGLIEGAINGALRGLPTSPSVHLPRFAAGTSFAPGGYALVGERGPEVVNLPRGSQVIPNNSVSRENSGNISINVNVGLYAGSEMEKRKVASALLEAMQDVASTRNMNLGKMLGI